MPETDWEGTIRPFFHRGMVHTWREDVVVSEEDIPGLPGWMVVRYEEGDLLLLDMFLETESKGLGHTFIYRAGQPIWATRWHGEWSDFKNALHVLRKAILDAHRGSLFNGGRGVHGTEFGDTRYEIFLDRNSFHYFAGRERVLRWGEILRIEFQGGSLV